MLFHFSCFDLQSQTILLESYRASLCICRYLCYWKVRLKEKPIKEFCPVININSKPGGKLSFHAAMVQNMSVVMPFSFFNINIRKNFGIECKEIFPYGTTLFVNIIGISPPLSVVH